MTERLDRIEAILERSAQRQAVTDAVTQMLADRDQTRAQAEADRAESARRFQAQQEVIHRLLIEMVEMNRDNRRLHDRIDDLGQAS